MNTNSIKKCVALLLSIAAGACFAAEQGTVEQQDKAVALYQQNKAIAQARENAVILKIQEINAIAPVLITNIIAPYLKGSFTLTTSFVDANQMHLRSEHDSKLTGDQMRIYLQLNRPGLPINVYAYIGNSLNLGTEGRHMLISRSPLLSYETSQEVEVRDGEIFNITPLVIQYATLLAHNKNLIKIKSEVSAAMKTPFFSEDETSLCLVDLLNETVDLYTRDEPDIDFGEAL